MFGVLIYYLTVNRDIQERLQDDIDDLFENKDPGEEISQDDINSMKYLDQVWRLQHIRTFDHYLLKGHVWRTETWLLCLHCEIVYSGLASSWRDLRHTQGHPSLHSHREFYLHTVVKKDNFFFKIGLHYDPQYYPDPERFDPDRFENKGSIDSSTFQTFGSGPRYQQLQHFMVVIFFFRQCLGKNLFAIESKILMIYLLRNFRLVTLKG